MQKLKFYWPVICSSCLSPLWLLAFTLLAVAQPVLAEPVKILPLGTWTAGLDGYVSYRYDLWFKLTDAGFDVDFVGNKKDPGGGVDMDKYPEYLTGFDRDHQGLEATLSSDMVGLATFLSAAHELDIVLLWAGPYDLLQQGAGGAISAKFAIPEIIEGIRKSNPGVTILLAECSHASPLEAAHVDALNGFIATIASEMETPESPVIVVDQVTGFDPTGMMSDGAHHNQVGEEWVAQNWFEVLADILPASEPFRINAGHAGAWYNPDTPGQGQLIDVEPGNQFMFLSWFTFTHAAAASPNQQHWFTAQGNYSGDTAELTVYETLDGEFDDPQEVTTDPVGSATLVFEDCRHGQLDYTIDTLGLEGSFPIQRAIPGAENVCAEAAGDTRGALVQNDGRDGAWFDPNSPGQGFLIDAHPGAGGDDFIFVAWFTYGEFAASGQRWLTAQGPLQGTTADIVVYETQGGSFDDAAPSETSEVGTMTIDFTDCSNALLSYSISDGPLAGMIDITRAIPGTGAACQEATHSE